jgi:hypothetical protein
MSMATSLGSSSNPHGPDGSTSGYFWIGDLAEVKVNSLYAACHSLRFTGSLELKDETHAAQVIFLGGDPVEISGGDTQVIALWNRGSFRAQQSLPNLTGELTGHIEQTGSLAITKAPRLLAWVAEYRLSCDLKIERPGENAHLVFRNGQLESADVNGRPELAALARVQGWSDGFYRVGLRPLFTQGGVIALQPPPSEGAAPAGREFDVSRSIPLDLKQRNRLATPAPNLISLGDPAKVTVEAERAAAKPARMPRLQTGSALDAVPRAVAQPLVQPPPPERRETGVSPWLWALLGLLIVAGSAIGTLFFLHLPPFSPPPRPIDVPAAKAAEKKDEPVVPAAKKDEPVVPAAKKDAPVVSKKDEPTEAPVKRIDPATLEPKTGEKNDLPQVAPLDQRLIDKGRLLAIDGHPHSALSFFKRAEQANPKNQLARTLEQQALGKLGRAEIVIDGRGEITIDGKRFDAGKRLKVLAGPHNVDGEEIVLKKGEKKHLRAHP